MAVTPIENTLGQAEFMQLLLAQLTQQDPLKPMDNTAFVAQMAQFSALAQSQQLNDSITNLLTIQSSTQSMGLLGRKVKAMVDGGEVTGQVTRVSFAGGLKLTIDQGGGALSEGVLLSQIASIEPNSTTNP